MNVKEAHQFVADYSIGTYYPAEHAAFLQWVRKATVHEWEGVADQFEALQGQWVFSVEEPPPGWIAALEHRLDRLAGNGKRARVLAVGFRSWVAVASIVALILIGIVLYIQSGRPVAGNDRSGLLATLTQTSTVARGGNVHSVTLPDGSTVWLNFGSTLRYPTIFSGSERVVELSGEGYFDVSQRSDKPFRVLFRDAEVKVLGTRFNIIAYDDEPVAQATLIDGAISIESGSQRVTLHPGERGEISYPSPGATGPAPGATEPIQVVPGIDPGDVVAWKDGVLKFDNTDLRAVFRILSRCYAIEIRVGQDVPAVKITGTFSSTEDPDLIWKQLEREHLHIIKDGKIVIVTLAK